MTLGWTFAFNIVVNSFLGFLTVAMLVQLLIFVFRVKSPRILSLCLSLPVLKLGLDLFLYNFSRWALMEHINPIQCPEGSRMITAMCATPASTWNLIPFNTGIHLGLKDGKTFTVADMIALSVEPLWIKGIVAIAFAGALVFVVLRCARLLKARGSLDLTPCKRPLFKTQTNTPIFSSSAVDVPCAYQGKIIFPVGLLDDLSQEEYEAVVAHELGHLRWKDIYARVVIDFVCDFFWWVPTRKWRMRVKQAQEIACDARIKKSGIDPIDLANAITKSARFAKKKPAAFLATAFVEKGSLAPRIKAMFERNPKRSLMRICLTLLMTVFLLSVLFGQFWIF